MNKKAYLILLAVAAHQSSIMASWSWNKKNTEQTPSTTQTDTPVIAIRESLSKSGEYKTNVGEKLLGIYIAAKSNGSVDIMELESTIITEYTPRIIQPGLDALKEAEASTEQAHARNKVLAQQNDAFAQELLWAQRKGFLLAVATLAAGVAIGHYYH